MKRAILLFLCFFVSCTGQPEFTDTQGHVYPTVEIGGQTWMASDLNYDVAAGSYCYNDSPSGCAGFGRLYTWEAARAAAEKIDDWHLPSKEEWVSLLAVCGEDSAGFVIITAPETGFNPLWAGVRVSRGEFKARGKGANYWSSTPCDTNATLAYSVAVMNTLKIVSAHNYPQDNACSVRLVKD